ncbi:MAG TPA: glycosyltransferase family 4 protein, partial [Candidatus Thermoplasmatota archaeon]|nr:glycosyltransferase family 4 protein [Candidatus Thermoplasmatota archaeon]
MRILHVTPRFLPAIGGGERHVAALASEQAARGHEVHVGTTKLVTEVPHRLEPSWPDDEVLGKVHVHRWSSRSTGLPLWGYGFTIPDLEAKVAALRPEVVHLHGYGYRTGDQLAAVRRRGAPWKLVMVSHGFIPGRGPMGPVKSLYSVLLGRRTVATLDAAIALSPRDEATFKGLGARRVTIIPNGVDYERFAAARPDPALLARLGFKGKGFVLSASRLEVIKGQDLLIEAFGSIAAKHAGVELLVASEGSAGPRFRALAERVAPGRVRFAGRVTDDEVRALMASALLFAHTPREEVFPLVLLEAMAAGLPVLATGVGGVPFECGG